METIPAKITPRLAAAMDEIIEEGWYANRSEFIRDAVRDKIRSTKTALLEAAIKEDVEWGLHGKD
ncbi:ribbon-helix-helix protein, CopG family [Candidatus Woesearchaeota archaeon]|nr:ribbon-helix-helix protein, CopG family [Candidatus Woesearchaeota archaeon]